MLKTRIIPVLTFNGISLVKTKQFNSPRIVGNPIQAARVYNNRDVDEIIFLDIKAKEQKRKLNLPMVKKIIDECFMPISIGGGVETFDDINNFLRIGADKVIIKTKAIEDPIFVSKAVDYFGSQCISISVDVIQVNGKYFIFNKKNNIPLETFIQEMNNCKVGEYAVNSVDRDGMMQGYDLDLYKIVNQLTNIPVIAIGGAGTPEHFVKLCQSGFKGALAAASIFHFTQHTPQEIKRTLDFVKIPVRI